MLYYHISIWLYARVIVLWDYRSSASNLVQAPIRGAVRTSCLDGKSNPIDLQIAFAPDRYRPKRNSLYASADLLVGCHAHVDSGARAVAREAGGDIHGIAPDIEAELLPTDDASH